MRTKFKLAALALTLAGTLPALAAADVKVGFMATLSGPSAAVGQDQLDGFQLALEQLGGKLGGVPATLIVEDDHQKPDTALTSAARLIERENVDVIAGLTFAHVLMALQPTIAQTQVPFIGTVAGPSPTAGKLCKPNLFITSWQSDTPAEAMGKYLQDQGVKRVSLLTPNFVGGKDKLSGFKKTYEGKVLDEIYTPLNQLDFSAELTQVSSSDPDAVFMFYPGALAISFVRQYRQAGLADKYPLYSANSIEGAGVAAMGEAVFGSKVVDTWTPGIETQRSKDFVAAYEKKYNRLPSAYAAFSYDAAMLLDAAVASMKGDVSDKKAFNAAIKNAKFESLRGDFRFGNNNYPVQSYHVFEIVKGDDGKARFKTIAKDVLKDQADSYAAECTMS
ncbi:ABC transporter substrate-binding protein [Pusillimonas noertemannii]|uniref:Branched-chain amino acid transport system substrate-binding protein n=1 Tax=Pusillimonas noertemannii TaxID=305977 RepID=A0A2U1CQ02_9BURK|nr:ABC transporter substrate-binding protein [Pusillimonas noertemannii]NYT67290.1 ABC transporter substrate-binding protein [Pusillimonas noertemannii]PVY67963.1 branched-chain amino acid transport system substrate-binding protein [Pusillimonas noertemannii]TFL12518.1 ABC transporter substrate-binding protein [Pusillimonas noertemannii]